MTLMMSTRLGAFAAAAALALGLAGAVQAATVTPGANSTQLMGNTADVYASTYAANTPLGAAWDVDPTVSNPPLSVAKDYKSPFLNTTLADTQSYFAVKAGGASNGNGVTTSAVLTFSKSQNAFRMLWGSIDAYNRIEFFDGMTSVFAYDGAQLASLLGLTAPNPKQPANFEWVSLVTFSDFGMDGFDSVRFSSGSPAFEFAIAPIPVPAAGLLLLTAVGGMAALRRRKATAA